MQKVAGERYVYRFACDPDALFTMAFPDNRIPVLKSDCEPVSAVGKQLQQCQTANGYYPATYLDDKRCYHGNSYHDDDDDRRRTATAGVFDVQQTQCWNSPSSHSPSTSSSSVPRSPDQNVGWGISHSHQQEYIQNNVVDFTASSVPAGILGY